MRDIALLERKAMFLPGFLPKSSLLCVAFRGHSGRRKAWHPEPWERSILMALRRRRNRRLASWKPFLQRRQGLQALVSYLTHDLRQDLKYLPQVAYLTYVYYLCSCLSTSEKDVPELFGYDYRNPPHVWSEALAAYDLYLSSLPPSRRASPEEHEKQRKEVRGSTSRTRRVAVQDFTLSGAQLEPLGGIEHPDRDLTDNWLYEMTRRDSDSPWQGFSKTGLRRVQTELLESYHEGRAPVFLSILCHIGLRKGGASWQEVADSAGVSRRTVYEYRTKYPVLEALLRSTNGEPLAMPRDPRARWGQTRAELARGETGKDPE